MTKRNVGSGTIGLLRSNFDEKKSLKIHVVLDAYLVRGSQQARNLRKIGLVTRASAKGPIITYYVNHHVA